MGLRRPRCRHCGTRPAAARGLCVDHYVDPEVRASYADAGADGESDSPARARATPLKDRDEPTAESPGGAGKVAVLARRWRLGLPLFEPGDAGRDDEAELRRIAEHQREDRDE